MFRLLSVAIFREYQNLKTYSVIVELVSRKWYRSYIAIKTALCSIILQLF